jgi:integrase
MLFVDDWKMVWDRDLLRYTANKIAALTGMRCCEVLGLRGEYVYDDHIFLCGQYDEYGYRETKTKIKHHMPLTAELVADLRKLMKLNGNGYIFSLDGGITPVTRRHVYNGLAKALNKIGITDEEIKERGLNIHAWRHFCNTEHYTHFDPLDFGEVPKIQAALLKRKARKQVSSAEAFQGRGSPPETADDGRPALAIVKMPEGGNAAGRKQAS